MTSRTEHKHEHAQDAYEYGWWDKLLGFVALLWIASLVVLKILYYSHVLQ